MSDQLADFLFYGKTGFCEQYASAMAAMLRTLDIPVRVAIGFTDGYSNSGHQTITSQDAHAWDQVYFPGYGWVTFDPTPLTDGRTQVPGYLNTNQNSNGSSSNSRQRPDGATNHTTTTPAPTTTARPAVSAAAAQTGGGWSGPPIWELAVVLPAGVGGRGRDRDGTPGAPGDPELADAGRGRMGAVGVLRGGAAVVVAGGARRGAGHCRCARDGAGGPATAAASDGGGSGAWGGGCRMERAAGGVVGSGYRDSGQ